MVMSLYYGQRGSISFTKDGNIIEFDIFGFKVYFNVPLSWEMTKKGGNIEGPGEAFFG